MILNRAERRAKLYELERLVASGGSEDEINSMRIELNIQSEETYSREKIDFDVDKYLSFKKQQKNEKDIAALMGMTYATLLKKRKEHGIWRSDTKDGDLNEIKN